MSRFFTVVLLIVGSHNLAQACDVCGCTLSHNVLPSDTRTYIGVGFRQSTFSGQHEELGALRRYREAYQFLDIMGKWSWRNRWEFMVNVPLARFSQHTEGVLSDQIEGLGDVNLGARYALINRVGRDNHRLSVGFMVDLPTGKMGQLSDDGVIYHARQAGSGSTNVVLMASYGFKRQTWGFQAMSSVKINGTNALGYHRGNSLNGALDFFVKRKIKLAEVYPRCGLLVETSERNRLNGINYTLNTSRTFVVSNLAVDVYFRRAFVSVGYQIPLSQTLEFGQLSNRNRLFAGVNYVF